MSADCAAQELGRPVMRERRWVLSSTGCLPVRIASTIAGDRKASGNSLLTSEKSVPCSVAICAMVLDEPSVSAAK